MAAEYLARMGERLRDRRDEMGLSRVELARKMPGKVSENQIYRWEKGLHQPNPDTLEALARLLGKPVAYFMAPEPDARATPDLSRNGDAPGADRLAAIEANLATIRGQLEELLTYRREAREQLRGFDVEDARELFNFFQEIRSRQGRDVGRHELQSRRATGRSTAIG